MKRKVLDSWKRPIEIEVTEDLSERYPQQTELQLNKVRDATPGEWDEWQHKELDWWAEKQIPLVAFMAIVQLVMFGGMLSAFYLIGLGLSG